MTQTHSNADTWDKTIISFATPHKLRDLCITGPTRANAGETSEEEKFKIRLANSGDRRESASLLVNKRYAWRGYSTGVNSPVTEAPNRITLVSDMNGQTVGTMTLCFDSANGLPADEIFKDKLDELREQGRLLCEPTKLAIDESVPSKQVFASIIHISFIYAHNIHGYTDYVIEVNPRHVAFYKRMLGFADFGEERTCTRVNAPAVLLRLDLNYMAAEIERCGGKMDTIKERSFYPYFFSKHEESGITNRLLSGSTN